MSFLGKLADQIASQFSVGEIQDHSLDANGKKYGKLGDFANKFEHSTKRKYLEEGFLRQDPFLIDVKQYETLMQEPSATLLITKKMFSSVGENFRPDFMNAEEKLYYKAMKILFENKCRQISSYEKLSKIQKVSQISGKIDDNLMPLIFSLTDEMSGAGSLSFSGFQPSESAGKNKFIKVIDQVRKIYAFNQTNFNTTWIKDNTNFSRSVLGEGTGVIEITNFSSFNTSVGLRLGQSASFTIDDPYNNFTITEYDIERAISDATNMYFNNKMFQFSISGIDDVINNSMSRLNSLRKARGVGNITFKVNPDTLLGKRVVAIIDSIGKEIDFHYDSSGGTGFPGIGGFGNSVSVSEDFKINGSIAGINGIDVKQTNQLNLSSKTSELSEFNKVIANVYNKIQMQANSRNTIQTNNENTNYIRKKLKFNFHGRLIIQPQDVVHFYINSKTRYDNKLLTGLKEMFTGYNVLQDLNKSITDFKNSVDAVFNPGGNVSFQVEKSAYVGRDFPNALWSVLRSQFIDEKEGTHVWAGLVDTARSSYDSGSYSVSISCVDNSKYFEFGMVNFKPGADAFNGKIFDPLTPFKTSFDSITSSNSGDLPELLDENKVILGSSKDKTAPLIKSNAGRNIGERVTQENYVSDHTIDPVSGRITRVFYAPDGLAYKWKEGIQITTQFGKTTDINNEHVAGVPSLTQDPFAGQSVMNVISLCVTGVPYNFATYWKATSNIDGFGVDPQSKQSASSSFTQSLQNDLKKNNTLWGNFIPFKNIVMDEQSYAMALKQMSSVLNTNNLISKKLKEVDIISQYMALFGVSGSSEIDKTIAPGSALLINQYQNTQQEINKLIDQVDAENKSYFSMVGNDVSLDINQFLDQNKVSKAANDPNFRRLMRRQVNALTRRMSYNVRSNTDKNLLIIDDFYDKDYDVAAYERKLADGLNLFSSEFSSVKDKINLAASLLNLEVFCDSQGHVRVRPPQYNRMPSSIFNRMMYLKKYSKIQIFPEFLNDLFSNQLKTLRERLEIIEDEIRLDCASLNLNFDFAVEDFINHGDANDNTGSPFSFISDYNGDIIDIRAIIQQATEALNGEESQTISNINNQANSIRNIFSPIQRFQIIKKVYSSEQTDYSINTSINAFYTNDRVSELISRIETKSGVKISRDSFLTTPSVASDDFVAPVNQTVDVYQITENISKKLSERQRVVKLFYNAIKNVSELKSLDGDSADQVANNLLFPTNGSNDHIPEAFEHMIEDESFDDYGLSSGSRYVIKNTQIISYSFEENAPDYTSVEVQGNVDPDMLGLSPIQELRGAFPSGNGMTTAYATDFDLWRNYGMIKPKAVTVPFLTDPNSQLGPYASMLLSIARKNIISGSLSIIGNEHQQPGEVIYLEDKGMLYYTDDIRHSFTYGSQFTTQMSLSYGHTPGEYIPTLFDIIGKLIYSNRDVSSFEIQRQNPGNEVSAGVVTYDVGSSVTGLYDLTANELDSTPTSITSTNAQVINNILFSAGYIINSKNAKGSDVKAKLELRLYYDDSNPVDTNLEAFAIDLINVFSNGTIGPKTSDRITGNVSIDRENIDLIYVNMSSKEEKRSPSQKAIDSSKNLSNTSSFQSTDFSKMSKDKIRDMLYKYIVDIWVKIEPVSETKVSS